jgi:molybdenum cofactor synthesis domain-containing protein
MLAVILAIGREILRGRVQDTNSWTLARRLTGLGHEVIRITSCDDDLEAIVREIRRAAEDGVALVVTTGGLGPTDDDVTLQALAEATGCPLALHPEARDLVAARYAALFESGAVADVQMTASREKMAWLPQGATALPNPVGAAPGVWLEIAGVIHVALPGVPAEMTAVLEQAVWPSLAARAPGAAYAEQHIVTQARDESVVASVLRRLGRELPEVFLKSRPTHFGSDVRMEVFVSTWASDQSAADTRLARALVLLREALGEAAPPDT